MVVELVIRMIEKLDFDRLIVDGKSLKVIDQIMLRITSDCFCFDFSFFVGLFIVQLFIILTIRFDFDKIV